MLVTRQQASSILTTLLASLATHWVTPLVVQVALANPWGSLLVNHSANRFPVRLPLPLEPQLLRWVTDH